MGAVIDKACWGGLIGGLGYAANVAFSDGGFKNWNRGAFWKSVGVGAISGVVSGGIGDMFGKLGSFSHELGRTFTHGVANGMIAGMTGGDMMQGFASGALGSAAGHAFQAVGGEFAKSMVGTVGFSAVAGGIGAELTGGEFWRGAATGATIGLLNAAIHGGFIKKDSEVLIMEDTEGAGDKGHMAVAGGNNEKGWKYVSKYAKTDPNTGELDGGLISGGKSTAVINDYNTKSDMLSSNAEYDQFIRFKTTYKIAMRVVNATYKSALQDYHFMMSNCGHAVADGLITAGIFSGNSIIPNNRYSQIKKHYFPY